MDQLGSCSDPVQNFLSFPDHILEHLTICDKSLGASLAGVTRTFFFLFINLCPLRQRNHLSLLSQSHSPTQQITVSLLPVTTPGDVLLVVEALRHHFASKSP